MAALALCLLIAVALLGEVFSCTNIVVSPGASADSSSLLAYNADSASMFGELYHYPAADHASGSLREVYDWDTGKHLGAIPEVSHTYNVVGNVNEYGLSIGETTFGGIESLQAQSAAKIDYGSLIWITLQRSRNAREAIATMTSLVQEYGYASEGETFSIIDQNEAWVLEMIGKGEEELGAVWVAVRIPAGYVTAHANQARIRTFALDDPENVLYAPDVISFARKMDLFPKTASDESFSFSDVYDPVTFSGARICEARVWSVFSTLMGADFSQQYLDYAMGYNLTNRMPLFVKPPSSVSVSQVMDMMRSHFEGSQLDMSGQVFSDVGATTNNVFRTHPLFWSSSLAPNGDAAPAPVSYLNERPIATPQTGWNFVAQSRRWMPRQFAGLLWFGVDDSSTTVRFPVYGSATAVAPAFAGKGPQDGVTPAMMKFSFDKAFYVFNLVANWAYSRWDLISLDLSKAISAKQTKLLTEIKSVDQKLLDLVESESVDAAVEYGTNYSVQAGTQLVQEWLALFGELFVKYRDGYVITANPADTACGCNTNSAGYPQQWYDRIVRDAGEHYVVLPDDMLTSDQKKAHKTVPKSSLKSFR